MADSGAGKGCLFVVALSLGIWLGWVSYQVGRGLALSAALAVSVAFLYPISGAWAVSICQGLRSWAFPENKESDAWDSDKKAQLAALWPFWLLFWLVISPFFALINRLFRG